MKWLSGPGWQEYLLLFFFLAGNAIFFFRLYLISSALKTPMHSRVYLKFLLRFTYTLLLFGAILGPVDLAMNNPTDKSGSIGTRDIHLFLDISHSMDVSDVQGTRLNNAKAILSSLIQQQTQTHFSLTLFSSGVYRICPLTSDTELLQTYIQNIHSDLIVPNGSDWFRLSGALQAAINTSEAGKKASVMIITDGEFHDDPDQSLKLFYEKKPFQSLWIGIGSTQGGIVPAHGEVSRLNRSSLQKMASMLNGTYLEAAPGRQLLPEIQQWLKANPVNAQTENDWDEQNRYYLFLIPAFFLVILDLIFPAKTLSI
jgi:Ca-activated chloride channel family protein